MKKLSKMFMIVLLVLGLVACGADKGSDTDSTDFEGKTLTIGIWGGNDREEASLQALIDSFEEETGAIIESKVYTEYNTQIQADLIGNTAPDVFYVDASMYPFFHEQGALMELDADKLEASEFYDTLIDTFSTDGKLYAVPKDFSTLSVYVNLDVFEDTGVDVDEIPGSFEELVDWIPGFQAKINEVYGEDKVFAMSYNPEMARNLHLAERDGASIVKDGGFSNLADEKVLDNLSILNDLVNTGGFVTPQDIGTGWNGEAFGIGKLAMMDEGNWVYETLKTEYSDINFKVIEMPTYKSEKGSMMFTVGWGKYAGTKNSELADAWIKHVTGFDGMKVWVEGTGTLPSRQDVAEAAKIVDNADLNTHLEAWEFSLPWQKGVTVTTIDDAYKNFITEALNGNMTLQEAMQKAESQANADIEAVQ